eukprot:scaffold1561_cov73-Isochrysis_galbana.AAC.3
MHESASDVSKSRYASPSWKPFSMADKRLRRSGGWSGAKGRRWYTGDGDIMVAGACILTSMPMATQSSRSENRPPDCRRYCRLLSSRKVRDQSSQRHAAEEMWGPTKCSSKTRDWTCTAVRGRMRSSHARCPHAAGGWGSGVPRYMIGHSFDEPFLRRAVPLFGLRAGCRLAAGWLQ